MHREIVTVSSREREELIDVTGTLRALAKQHPEAQLMALFSTVVIWCGDSAASRAAGIRYAILHLLGGVVLNTVGAVSSTASASATAPRPSAGRASSTPA